MDIIVVLLVRVCFVFYIRMMKEDLKSMPGYNVHVLDFTWSALSSHIMQQFRQCNNRVEAIHFLYVCAIK